MKNFSNEYLKEALKTEVRRKMFTPNFYFRIACMAMLWLLTLKNFEVVSKIETL